MARRSTYRKLRSGGAWHFCIDCREWPAQDFDEISSTMEMPAAICGECHELERGGKCRAADEFVP